jgi:hypothetical protein
VFAPDRLLLSEAGGAREGPVPDPLVSVPQCPAHRENVESPLSPPGQTASPAQLGHDHVTGGSNLQPVVPSEEKRLTSTRHPARRRSPNPRFQPTIGRAIRTFGQHTLDGRTTTAKTLGHYRARFIADLGGLQCLSAQQVALLDLTARTWLLLETVDAAIFSLPSPLDRRRRVLLPIIRERQHLADSLLRYLQALGLERHSSAVDLAHAFQRVPANGSEVDE